MKCKKLQYSSVFFTIYLILYFLLIFIKGAYNYGPACMSASHVDPVMEIVPLKVSTVLTEKVICLERQHPFLYLL